VISYGLWFASSGEHGFAFEFRVDGLSLGFTMLSTAVCGVVSAFSQRYLHRDPGFTRYFTLFAGFVSGMVLVSLAGSIEVLFTGWELLGLSSALLVAYFHERRAPVTNALRVFAVYRLSDAAMLAAAVLLHHWAGTGSLALLFSDDPGATVGLDGPKATLIAILLIAAVAGKSALLPFSGWLPRAMEGPTPSSAVYYGSLSIHAGCFLLLRAEPLLAQSPMARALAAGAGVLTALYATITARVQTDVKSSLAYASLTQVGIIVLEIALGLTSLAFVHMVGHACFRLLQFLSAPNLLHDLHELEASRGDHPIGDERRAEAGTKRARALYLLALSRGFVDELIDRWVVAPFAAIVTRCDRLDRWLCGFGDDAAHDGGAKR
jgi:NAD(P)H-quinone oxidoreductase subunit 5